MATLKQDGSAAELVTGFLAKRRDKSTKRSVILVDRIADWSITVGGLLVILAVVGIMVFLIEVVVPLFAGGEIVRQFAVAKPPVTGRVLLDRIDEYNTISVSVDDNGRIGAFHIATGTVIEAPTLDLGGRTVTAFGSTLNGRDIAFGFASGEVVTGRLAIDVQVVPRSAIGAGARPLGGTDFTDGTAVYTELPGDQARRLSVSASLAEPQQVAPPGTAIVGVAYRLGGTVERPTTSLVSVDAAGIARLTRGEARRNLLTGAEQVRFISAELPGLEAGVEVADVLLTSAADQVYIADRGGRIFRFDTRDFANPKLAETRELFSGGVQLSTMRFLIGDQSLVVGGTDGSVNVYFRLQRAGVGTADGYTLVRAHTLEPQSAAITHIEPSQRGKLFVTADASGAIAVRHSTSDQTFFTLRPEGGGTRGFDAVALAPRENAVLAIGDGRVHVWEVSIPHPETTLQTIFGRVWYEGYDEPTFTWQSSSGTDEFEPKFSLVPLIFGTIKATVYSLLFAIPIALGAAIYTSEFVHPTVRSVVKPAMEMMASLPSVVLGFIAALILAPIVETWIAAVLLAFIALPLSLFAAAYLWQLLPGPLARQLSGLPKFALMFVVLLLGIGIAYNMGNTFERVLFNGNFKAWVDGAVGSGQPFTFLLLLPVSVAVTLLAGERLFGSQLERVSRELGDTAAGGVDLARWLVLLVAGGILAWVLAAILTATGFDARGGVVDTYVQRNTLVVGFAMGFAVIPIIYTIAEDALNAVPEHLRAASLACGASPWQTATRIILPTAFSGVFAAIMIGMGRAVGETMIVVMAAGNTPVMDWNIFNGLRALSANIAVELPEAVRDGTLYRMLFLAALTLFAMTFVVNTLAEVVRLRFRKRAASL